MLKDRLSKTSGWQFHKWLFGPEKFSGLSRNGPQVIECNTEVAMETPGSAKFEHQSEKKMADSLFPLSNQNIVE